MEDAELIKLYVDIGFMNEGILILLANRHQVIISLRTLQLCEKLH